MTEVAQKRMLNELDTMVAMADELKDKAARLRKKLEPFQAPAPKGALTGAQQAKIIARRRKHWNKISK